VLYVSPLRAMTRDIELAIREPIRELALPFTVESRTGDTSSSQRQKQGKKLPTILVTTPESAALLLARDNAPEMFADLRCVVVDEWHELLSTKRGTQVELLLTRLRALAPRARTWALSATIRNLDEALQAAVGMEQKGELVREEVRRDIRIETLIPDQVDAFPWAGHLGLPMLRRLVEAIDISSSTLVFTNVRSQTERWFQAILEAKPEWAPVMGLHHGSLDRDDREATETGLKNGAIRLVVCTSSLDLGVDFAAVEQVFQIGRVCPAVLSVCQHTRWS
jgi:ATP-dependent Lhr-like helicase